ncbi:MAG: Bax inhibitor-1/YccA family protein [Rickettsiales bacterium]|jgi:FtsH-binding integral membrane protein|nr:Bax inhibitor-1/YccA family protein [Rickettsiales bacterium]
MVAKKSAARTSTLMASVASNGNGIEIYLKRIFTLMFGAVGLTAISTFIMLATDGFSVLIGPNGFSGLYYILLFGGLGLAIWAHARVFSLKPSTAALFLALYSVIIGMVLTPLVAGALYVNPASILQAFIIAALMFGCMAIFGYKTIKDLSFLGTFLFIGMIGLILVGIISMIWPLGSTLATIICLIGVLIFALFTAYDMQNLKKAYASLGDDTRKNQLAVLGALHLYISFIAMFQYTLSLLNNR